MAARALKRQHRTLYAAALLVGAFALLLVAWFYSGWATVRAEQRDLRAAPVRAAEQKAATLSTELRSELSHLRARETDRDYLHYQNLFHDSRMGNSVYVAPSPLASGPKDPMVLGYFQLDVSGKLTTPTINDDVPHLSEPTRLAENRQFRDEVTRSFALQLKHTEVAIADTYQKPESEGAQQGTQVLSIDPQIYRQNNESTRVYWSNFSGADGQAKNAPPVTWESTADGRSVQIFISPLEWHTFPYGGQPALVAVRSVKTPDGTIAQGFVVDRSTLTTWLAGHAGDAVAELVTKDEPMHDEIAPGWAISVKPNPHAIAAAASEASSVASSFLMRFIVLGLIAAAMATLVVFVVSGAERVASERSQFAAAAAHELRTPLAGLQLYGDMLADGLGDPAKLRDYAKRMSEEASRLGRVVSNVLGFSQLERGNLSVDPKPGPLGEVLKELAERAEPALDRAGAMLALDVSPDLRATFDRDALIRIVGNLLDNAEKYSRAAEDRTIELVARTVEDRVEVSVTDHGPGVAQPAKLFQAFSRGVDADGPAGLGLGLALSQSLAVAMGGTLEYRPGTGATFVLRLPAA